ncbi:sugar phosphate nucleotidyltransferase [Candidatus Kuenenia stuttgartensis]|uniref:sugar phosphate nucleotidyltransferase n=1 Tax=Kuenenia stuttgartiensis TaxID=174633 RepID=UPI001E294F07|nr:sugar phosphate nucleotidyltransferase [Candidatus Kuenenia stuttgartiensis]
MEAIILAGGYGTRLQSVIKDIPKPMADINGRPFLSYLMDYLLCQNIRKILLSVGYKHEIIKNYFGLRYKNLDIEYVIEDKPLGTGGAIKEALKWVEGDDVVVLNGDTFFYLELKKLIEFHLAQDAILTIAVKLMHNFDRYGTVVLKEGKIINFEEKTFKAAGYINGGVYVIKKRFLSLLI